MSDGWGSDGRDSDRIGYFGDGGADPNGCNVGYPGADECFACMIERCCLLMGGLDQVAANRYTARGGDHLFREWSAHSIPRSEEADAWHWVGRYSNNGLVACARHCVASALAASIDTSTAVDRCLDDCTEVFVPDCQRTAEEILVVEVFRSASMQFHACMLSGPEANATLGSPPDDPYPSCAQDHSRPRDMPYEARYAETSCARVCFGVEPSKSSWPSVARNDGRATVSRSADHHPHPDAETADFLASKCFDAGVQYTFHATRGAPPVSGQTLNVDQTIHRQAIR
jgi:hypothetical protein